MLNPLSNPSYLLPPLVVSGVCLILIAVVLRDVRRSWASWIFCGLLLSVAVVSLLLFVMRTSPDAQQALIWVRIVAAVGTPRMCSIIISRLLILVPKGKDAFFSQVICL